MRIEDESLELQTLVPAMIVSVTPAFQESLTAYPTAATAALLRIFGSSGLRICEACMAPRTVVSDGRLEVSSSDVSVAEIIRIDHDLRGNAAPARTAIWLDETEYGVALRVVDLKNARILVAENVDATLSELQRTERNGTLVRELARRARGDTLAHAFIDAVFLGGPHVSLDWTDQWGDHNENLSGISLSLVDPIFGIGGVYYRAIPSAYNATIGVKVLVSTLTALIEGISGENFDILDPLITGVFIARVPIAKTNYAVVASASTNGAVGIGVSFLNMTLLPVLP